MRFKPIDSPAAWPDGGEIPPRAQIARLVAASGTRPRLWCLQAGPGSGKARAARQIAEALGAPVFMPGPPDRLVGALGLDTGAEPARVADALAARARIELPGGATFVWLRPDREAPGDAGREFADAFLRRWIDQAPDGATTILTSRAELSAIPAYQVVSGQATILGAPDLWLDPAEVAAALQGTEGPPGAARLTCGWPAAVAALRRLGGRPGLIDLLEDLAAAELLGPLPGPLCAALPDLAPLPAWPRDEEPLGDPDLARALVGLARWGLLVRGDAPATLVWHPLARRALGARQWGPPDRLAAWLHDQCARVPPDQARDAFLAASIGQLPSHLREHHPRVLLVAGTLALRSGSYADAEDRLLGAARIFEKEGDAGGAFAAHARRVGIHLQREAVAEGLDAAKCAEALEPHAEVGERVVYHVNRGNLDYLAGDEEAAIGSYRRALDFPHLGRARIALVQQDACLNLAVLCFERADLGPARRAVRRALALHAEHPVDPTLPTRARLELALIRATEGQADEASAILADLAGAPRPAHPYQLAFCRRVEGETLVLLGRLSEAERELDAALDGLAACGLERSADFAATLAALADLAWRLGSPDVARRHLDAAEPLSRAFPRLLAHLLEQRARLTLAERAAPSPRTPVTSAKSPPRLEIRTFGAVDVRAGGSRIAFPRRKARVLLAHLLMVSRGLGRDECAEQLYPDRSPGEARHQVDNLTSALRRALGSALIKDAGRYRLDRAELWWDGAVFQELIASGDAAWGAGDRDAAAAAYEEATQLYSDDLLAEPDLADFFAAERQAFRELALLALERAGTHSLEGERFETARAAAERLIALEPAHEGAYRLLMRLYAALGETGLATRQFRRCCQALSRHLDAEPSELTRQLAAELTARSRPAG